VELDGNYIDACHPLMLASWKGHVQVVKRLLALGAEAGRLSSYGESALHWACLGNRPSCLTLLLDAPGGLLGAAQRK
jgi:ankyrin repeat protein